MIGVRVYAAPVIGGVALVVPERALRDVRDTAYLLAHRPSALRVDVLVGREIAVAGLEEHTCVLLRRAAVAATLPGVTSPAGPRGRWYTALVVWGWLTLLSAAQIPAQVLSALWLALGLPWARNGYERRVRSWEEQAAASLDRPLAVATMRQLPHAGLLLLDETIAAHQSEPAQAYRTAAFQCSAAGVADLAPFYLSLAEHEEPDGIWALLPQPLKPAETESESESETDETSVAAPEKSPTEAAAM